MFPELRFTEAEIRKMIDSATPEAVANSLAKEKRNYFDLLNLISPAAMRFLPQMRGVAEVPPPLLRKDGHDLRAAVHFEQLRERLQVL